MLCSRDTGVLEAVAVLVRTWISVERGGTDDTAPVVLLGTIGGKQRK